ncbi:uncharacterized protein RAG0_07316 [Rhynchosporium agropyri]|uniref:Uncharacterized protein n=2 Tax=Rhynchosporium TaxID=38037 RepID=A0A1E1M508_RHYSE|nr:uncharacterized protein RAG0_07316 [Rhynchosporium agropyri]CZT44177.1 uncharacterized protein RSE6_04312 [Rhynchosporium secalis]
MDPEHLVDISRSSSASEDRKVRLVSDLNECQLCLEQAGEIAKDQMDILSPGSSPEPTAAMFQIRSGSYIHNTSGPSSVGKKRAKINVYASLLEVNDAFYETLNFHARRSVKLQLHHADESSD